MIIRRLEVRNFRKLVGPVVLDGLQAGLTVVVGDNEEGKSTLLQALRTVFFDRYNLGGQDAESFLPYNSVVRPEISVCFELQGKSYMLRKAFCQKPEAELRMPDGVLTGPAVEEKLQQLLRFTPPGRGACGEQHQGIWGLFWVEQGRGFLHLNQNPYSRSTLRSTLESEVGDVLGGQRGERLLSSVKQQHDRFFTRGGKPRGDYAQSAVLTAQLESDLATVEKALSEYEEKLDQLQRNEAALARHRADSTIENAGKEHGKAEEAYRAVEKLQRALKDSEAAAKVAEAEFNLAAAGFQQRQKIIDDLQVSRNDAKSLAGQLDNMVSRVQECSQRAANATEGVKQASAAYRSADARFQSADAAVRAAGLEHDASETRGHLERARTAKEQLDAALAAAGAIRVDDDDLKKLKKLEGDKGTAAQQLAAVATNVEIELEKTQTARIGDRQLTPPISEHLTEVTRIDLPGSARIVVSPGGDLEELRAHAEKTEEKLRRALASLGFADTAAAEACLAEKKGLLVQAEKQEALVRAHAPGGLEALQSDVAAKEAQLADLRRKAGDALGSLAEAKAALDTARGKRADAELKLNECAAQLKQHEDDLAIARQHLAKLQGNSETAANHLKALEDQLKEARDQVQDDASAQAVTDAQGKLDGARTAVAAARQQLKASEPEAVMLRLEAARSALGNIEADINKLQQAARDLRVELRALGQKGLGEDKDRLEGELAAARARQASLDREAQAIRLLQRVLSEAEKTAKETFLSPVTRHLRPYLKLLLPDAELRMNEDIEIVGLQRGAVIEDFEHLSVGTREQLAVLTRLAFADLLREKGQPAAVILDDAIAYADRDRFERMQLILRKASKNLQVIVLTCDERDYQSLGAPIVRLDQCRVRTAAEPA
jgi:hypothetical protein